MNVNVWQYLVLLAGLGAIATAAGIAWESYLRSAKMLALANLGVALIALSACGTLLANVRSSPTLTTWVSAAGFALYDLATVVSWLCLTFRWPPSWLSIHGRSPHPR
jgi:hypothetical protein